MLGPRRLIPSTSMLMAFEAASRSGSFTAAAHELNLTQGAISRQVGALEEQLSVSLFIRSGKTVRLSEAGAIYAKDIRSALKSIRDASLNAISDPQGGILNLAILPTFAMRWLMPRFPEFLKKNPQITVNFASKLSPFDFRSEALHAAVHYGQPDWPHAECTYMMDEYTIPVAAPSLIADKQFSTATDLSTLPLLHLETRPDAWQNWFHQNGIDASKSGGTVFEQFALVTQAAIAGMGAALLPKFLIQPELERGELVALIDTPLETDDGYYLVTPSNRSNYAPVMALRQWLMEKCQLQSE